MSCDISMLKFKVILRSKTTVLGKVHHLLYKAQVVSPI